MAACKKKKWYWAIGCGAIAISYMALNYARFGNITEFGHNYLPEFTRTTTGQFNLSYLKRKFNALSASAGSRGKRWCAFVFLIGWNGVLADCADFYYHDWCLDICAGEKREGNLTLLIMLPLLAVAHLLIICCHKTLGGWQFGNRYLLDMMPYLFFWSDTLETKG